jgi:hypothetical protein
VCVRFVIISIPRLFIIAVGGGSEKRIKSPESP